jgi:cell wall assembly regulator SMI1
MAMKNWPSFLKKLSKKLFEDAAEFKFDLEGLAEEEPERIKSRWLGFPGATPEAITARETALGTRLPDDYRGFLLASNGFRGLADLPHGLCDLLPVEDIGWMRDKDEEVGRVACYLEDRKNGVSMSEEFMVDPEDFARTLLIGDFDDNECILLLPPKTSGEWEVWTYDPETGFITGGTFDDFMESALEA